MNNALVQWFKTHKGWSHSMAVVAVTCLGLYIGNDQFHAVVNQTLAGHPRILSAIGTAITLYTIYHNSQRPTP